ncbi:MlaD family protein [Campylobacter sp. CCS1377]|uniref:MlaD family protein n=1 Tax=Campylobacter sp. CCS1377 TaxID=3158229 RepID=A0AAU7E6T0_9BACT
MENRANYFFVGFFVFGVFFAGIFFVMWMSGFSQKQEFEYYQIYTQESVAGLGIKAPVRFLGVEIGSVEEINIDTKEGIGVSILIKVKKGTPIKEDTYANLQFQGITGLKFIQLQGGSNEAPFLKTSDKNIATIKIKESFLSTFDRQSGKLFSLVETADNKTKVLLSDQNLKNLSIALENLASVSKTLNKDTKVMTQKIINASEDISKMAKAIEKTANYEKFNQTLDSIEKSANAINNLSQKISTKFDEYDEIKYDLGVNLELLRRLLVQSNEFIRNLEQSPSDLLFKKSSKNPAPGEKR